MRTLMYSAMGPDVLVTARTIDAHRGDPKKLGPVGDTIRTIRGVGYLLSDEQAADRGSARGVNRVPKRRSDLSRPGLPHALNTPRESGGEVFRGAGMPQSQSHRDQAGMPVRVRPSQADQVRICAGVWVVVIVDDRAAAVAGAEREHPAGLAADVGSVRDVDRGVGSAGVQGGWRWLRVQLRQIIESEPRTLGALREPDWISGTHGRLRSMPGWRRRWTELAERLDVQFKEILKKTRNLEALIDAMDEPLLATDNQEHILLCNRSAEAAFDAEPGTLVGRPVREVITQTELAEMHDAARGGQTRRARVRVTTPLGRRTYQVSALPVPVAWGRGVFGAVLVLRDVTELDQSVQIKTDFVANIANCGRR